MRVKHRKLLVAFVVGGAILAISSQCLALHLSRKKKMDDRRYTVRYGLGRDLVRQSQYPTDFIAALSDFLHAYNAESAQVMENRSGPYRRSIKTSDIEEITRLIDEYGSDVIAKLLVAFGYARVPRQAEEEK